MMFDLQRFLSNRPLALHREALAAIAERTQARVAGDDGGLRKTFAGISDGRRGDLFTRQGVIAVVSVTGLIIDDPFIAWLTDGTTPDTILTAVTAAEADRDVLAIVLLVNSPGGGVDLIEEIAAVIMRARQTKPVIALARTLMASAAYWIGSAADEVIASPSADVGSIGVFQRHLDESGLNAKLGITPTYIFAGRYKVETNFDHPLAAGAQEFLQRRVDEVYGKFVRDVARGRRTSDATVRAKFGEGRMFGAEEAVTRGMATRVDTFEAVMSGLAKSAPAIAAQRRAEHERLRLRTEAEVATLDATIALLERL